MRPSRYNHKAADCLALFFVFFITGCSIGGSQSVLPSIGNPEPNCTRILSSSEPQYKFHPVHSEPAFDRKLSGHIVDPKNEFDPKSLTCLIDNQTDLTTDLDITITNFQGGGSRYDWECDVPEKFLDCNRHHVTMTITKLIGVKCEIWGFPEMCPLEPPGIEFLVYPYRNVLKSVEEQSPPDPLKIFVALSGQFRNEWSEHLNQLKKAWWIEGIDEPLEVEFKIKSRTAIVNLPKAIEENTVLHFGKIELEEGIYVDDSEAVIVNYEGDSFSGCECTFQVNNMVDRHDALETEDHAWAFDFIHPPSEPPDNCPLHIDSSRHVITPGTPQSPSSVSIEQDADEGHFGTSYEQDWIGIPISGTKTIRASAHDKHYFELIMHSNDNGELCWSGFLAQDFQNADDSNPSFLEMRIAPGPSAAEWLEDQTERNGAIPVGVNSVHIDTIRSDICGLYALVRVKDEGQGGVKGLHTDWVDPNDNSCYGGDIMTTPHIWIDHLPLSYDEFRAWNDTVYQDPIPGIPEPPLPPGNIRTDYFQHYEELVMAINVDGYYEYDYKMVRFRVMDQNDNWSRSEDLMDEEFLSNPNNKTYTVTEMGIKTVDYNSSVALAEFCQVPVTDSTELEIVAQVVHSPFFDPPDYIKSVVTAPTHEGSMLPESITVRLYQIDPLSTRYQNYHNSGLFPPHPAGCNTQYYSRGDDLLGPCSRLSHVIVTDLEPTTQPVDTPCNEPRSPVLYVSDDDDLIALEGDPENDGWKDYSVALSNDPEVNAFYAGVLDDCFFGDSERGRFNACDNQQDYKGNINVDVLKCGVERVLVFVEGLESDIGVQSRGDAYFVLCHGIPEMAGGPQPWDNENSFVDRMGPFQLPNNNYITIPDWQSSGLAGDEVDWLISTACCLLNNGSWKAWRDGLVKTGKVKSICGFKDMIARSDFPATSLFQRFSEELTEFVYDPQLNLWQNGCIADDIAIIEWMENAHYWVEYAYFDDMGGKNTIYPELDAVAIDNNYRYELYVQKLPSWQEGIPWLHDKFFITRIQ